MKTYYRNKILINGIFPMKKFEIDGYKEKTSKYDENMINYDSEDSIFYSSGYLIQSLYSPKEKEGTYYEYFENDELIEINVDESIYSDNRKLQEYYLSFISKKVSFLEKKLRLITGMMIGLPVFNVNIYGENQKFKTRVGMFNNQSSCLKVWDYNDYTKNILEKRLKFYICDETLIELENKNNRFKRAFMFYNQSFLPSNRNVRFILLFSALESLFNIESKNITEDISTYGSKIQFLSKKKEDKVKWKLIDFYKIRSLYIHGNDPRKITEKQEFDLREIVRKTLLIYWNISINTSIENPDLINSYIKQHNQSNLDISIQLFIKSLDVINFSDFYKETRNSLLNGDYNILK